MRAKNIMTRTIVSVAPETTVRDVAKTLLDHHISAVPVVDRDGQVVGIVSEGDLMRRPELGTQRRPSWWLALTASPEEKAFDYIRSHGGHASDVMTKTVVSVNEDASLGQIAELLDRHHIKRVPVLRGNRLVGIVSRADLLNGLVASQPAPAAPSDDSAIAEAVHARLAKEGLSPMLLNVIVHDGIVSLRGAVESNAQKQALQIAVESVAGVKTVRNDVSVLPPGIRSVMWAE